MPARYWQNIVCFKVIPMRESIDDVSRKEVRILCFQKIQIHFTTFIFVSFYCHEFDTLRICKTDFNLVVKALLFIRKDYDCCKYCTIKDTRASGQVLACQKIGADCTRRSHGSSSIATSSSSVSRLLHISTDKLI